MFFKVSDELLCRNWRVYHTLCVYKYSETVNINSYKTVLFKSIYFNNFYICANIWLEFVRTNIWWPPCFFLSLAILTIIFCNICRIFTQFMWKNTAKPLIITIITYLLEHKHVFNIFIFLIISSKFVCQYVWWSRFYSSCAKFSKNNFARTKKGLLTW